MKKILILLITLFFTNIYAEEMFFANQTQEIDEVSVQAIRTKLGNKGLRAISILSKADIEQIPAASIHELLDNLPGIDIRSRGANGVQSDISMRGGTFDQVLVLLNGVNITDPQTGHLNLELPIDISAIDRIELLQGATMSMFGYSAMSGAINIVTGEAGKDNINASIEGGDYGYLNTSIGTKQNVEKWTITANGAYSQSSGYMKNTDFKNGKLFAHAALCDSVIGNISLQLGGQTKAFGANSFYSLKYDNQFENTRTIFASAQWEKRLGAFGIESNLYHRTLQDRFELIRNYEEAPAWYTFHNHHLTNVSGINVKGSWYSSIGKTSAGVELRNENIISNVLGDKLDNPIQVPGQDDSTLFIYGKNRLNLNYFVEQHFFIDDFSASVGISGNYNTMFSHNLACSASAAYRFTTNGNIFASFNRSIRLPTFTDLYYKSATQIANPNLQPEKSMTAEIGINYGIKGFNINASAYYRWGQNIIDWIKTPEEEKWRSMNHSNVNALGGEISASYSHGYWLKKIEATYSYCQLDKETHGYLSKYALDYLKHKITANLSHGIYKGFGASWSANYQIRNGEYTDIEDLVQKYKPVFTLDGRIYWQNSNLKIYVEASNITNTRYYDYGGILQAPIWVKGGIAINF